MPQPIKRELGIDIKMIADGKIPVEIVYKFNGYDREKSIFAYLFINNKYSFNVLETNSGRSFIIYDNEIIKINLRISFLTKEEKLCLTQKLKRRLQLMT